MLGIRRPTADRAVAWCTVAATGLFVLWQLHPSLLVRATTPGFNDLAGHYYTARQLRYRLLPRGEVFGWSMGWFTGYPVFTFYVPVASLVVAALGWLIPVDVALKLVAALGPVSLPLAAYAFGRLNGRDRLASACLAVAVVPLLLETLVSAAGGSISASVGSGEYAYGLAFSLGLVVLGLAGRGLRTGRHRALTACLLGIAALCHVIPTTFVFVGIGVMVALRGDRHALRWAAPVVAVAGALTAVWVVPLLLRIELTAGLPTPGSMPLGRWLFPATMAPLALLAGAGLLWRLLGLMTGHGERDDLFRFMLAMAAVAAAAFVAYPAGRIGIGRFVPVWFLWLSLLAGDALAIFARDADEQRRRARRGRSVPRPLLVRLLVAPAALAAVVAVWPSRAGAGLLTPTRPGASAQLRIALAGHEHGPKGRELSDLRDVLRSVGREHGCGRADWEWANDRWIESAVAFMFLVPHITDDCIQVTEGSWTQVSANTPFIDVTNQRLSADPAVLQGAKHDFDLARGLADLRMLGVRYFVAGLEKTQAEADRSPDLRLLAETKPTGGRSWKVYDVLGNTTLVEPLDHLPVVVPGSGRSRGSWEREAGGWYDRADREVLMAASGPPEWPRGDRATADFPRRPTQPITVEDIRLHDDRVTFRVSETGTPVLVKVSYFPNWRADGASGPWRVAPNHMVVIPTDHEVTLRYGRSAAEQVGRLVTLAGIAGAIVLARRGRSPRRVSTGAH